MKLRCKAKNSRGKPCSGYPVSGSTYCFAHDPKLTADRAAARHLGGEHRHTLVEPIPIPDLDLKTTDGLLTLIEQLIRESWSLPNSVPKARVVGSLAQVQKSLLERHALEQGLKAEEELVEAGLEDMDDLDGDSE